MDKTKGISRRKFLEGMLGFGATTLLPDTSKYLSRRPELSSSIIYYSLSPSTEENLELDSHYEVFLLTFYNEKKEEALTVHFLKSKDGPAEKLSENVEKTLEENGTPEDRYDDIDIYSYETGGNQCYTYALRQALPELSSELAEGAIWGDDVEKIFNLFLDQKVMIDVLNIPIWDKYGLEDHRAIQNSQNHITFEYQEIKNSHLFFNGLVEKGLIDEEDIILFENLDASEIGMTKILDASNIEYEMTHASFITSMNNDSPETTNSNTGQFLYSGSLWAIYNNYSVPRMRVFHRKPNIVLQKI